MTQTPFEQFIALVEVDQKINSLHSQIASLRQKNSQLIQEHHHQTQVYDKIKEKYDQTKKDVDSKELEMKILDQQESEKKIKLEHVSNHKEYQSIKSEIDLLKQSQHNLEESLIGIWNQLENAKKEFDSAAITYEQQEAQLKQQLQQHEMQINEINFQADELLKERVEKDKNVPEEWLQKYAIMRAKVADPVVPVANGSCSACFYTISAQDMQDLRRRKLVQCKDCYRLLYLQEAQKTAQE